MRYYNLQPLKKSRLKSGDVFAMLIDQKYIFGRIIYDKLSFENSPFGGSNLIYIYNVKSSSSSVAMSDLNPDNLLIPPIFISDILWSRGFTMKVGHHDISDNNLLKQHCFFSNVNNTFFDEKGNQLTSKTMPCGDWSYVVGMDYIDNKISDALEIKRAPLTEEGMYYISGQGEKIWYKQPIKELKRYSNFEEIVEKYPEVVE